jgi:hypothetical protein
MCSRRSWAATPSVTVIPSRWSQTSWPTSSSTPSTVSHTQLSGQLTRICAPFPAGHAGGGGHCLRSMQQGAYCTWSLFHPKPHIVMPTSPEYYLQQVPQWHQDAVLLRTGSTITYGQGSVAPSINYWHYKPWLRFANLGVGLHWRSGMRGEPGSVRYLHGWRNRGLAHHMHLPPPHCNVHRPSCVGPGAGAQYRNISEPPKFTRPDWCRGYAYTPKDLDGSLFTHVNYAFAKLEPGTFQVSNQRSLIQDCASLQTPQSVPSDHSATPGAWAVVLQVTNVEHNDDALIAELVAVRNKNRGLKLLISIGGWSFSRGDQVFQGSGSEVRAPTSLPRVLCCSCSAQGQHHCTPLWSLKHTFYPLPPTQVAQPCRPSSRRWPLPPPTALPSSPPRSPTHGPTTLTASTWTGSTRATQPPPAAGRR